MIANLIVIVSVYVLVRLIALGLRQFPGVETHVAARMIMTSLAMTAALIVVACMADSLLRTKSPAQGQLPALLN